MDRTPPQQQRGGRAAIRTPLTGRAHLSSARRRSAAAGLRCQQDGEVKADSGRTNAAVVADAAAIPIPSSLVLQFSRSGIGLPTGEVVHQVGADEKGPNADQVASPASGSIVGGVVAGMAGVGGAGAGVAAARAQTRLGSSHQVNVFPSLCLSGFGSHRVEAVEYESSDDEDGLDGDLTRVPSTSFGRTKRALQLEAFGLTPETVAQLYGCRSDLDEIVRPSAVIFEGVRSSDASVQEESVCNQTATGFDRPESYGGGDAIPGLRTHFDSPVGLAVSRLGDGTDAGAFRGSNLHGLGGSARRVARTLDSLSAPWAVSAADEFSDWTGSVAVGFVKRCRLE